MFDIYVIIWIFVGYFFGFLREVIEIFNLNFIVIIEVVLSEIFGRCLCDFKRDRDVEIEE